MIFCVLVDIDPSLICWATFLGSFLLFGATPGILAVDALDGTTEGAFMGLIEGIEAIGFLIGDWIALSSSITLSNALFISSIRSLYHASMSMSMVEIPFFFSTRITLENKTLDSLA